MRRAVLLALLAAALAPAAAQADYAGDVRATPGLLAHWPLDEAAGAATVTDDAGGLAGATLGSTALGRPAGVADGRTAMHVPGGSGGVSLGDVAPIAGDLSIEAWVSVTGGAGSSRTILSKGGTASGYHLAITSAGALSLTIGTATVTGGAVGTTGWHHVVGTLSGTTARLYVDGVAVASGVVAGTPPATTNGLYLGRSSRTGANAWQGGLDEVALYRAALDAATVAAHFAAGAGSGAVGTVLTSTPAATTSSSSAAFAFRGTRGGLTFTCRLDGGTASSCNGAFSVSGLRAGAHVLLVQAADRNGVLETPATSHAWVYVRGGGSGGGSGSTTTKDTTPPVTTIVSAPPPLSSSSGAAFSFAAGEAGVAWTCRLDGAAWAACPASSWFDGLGEGQHTLEVLGRDAAGLVELVAQAVTWSVDLTAPDTLLLAARPAGPGAAGTASFATEDGARLECRLGEGAWAPCASPATLPVVPVGTTFAVRAIDAAGNVDATPAIASLGEPGDAGAIPFAVQASFTVAGQRSDGTLECRLDAGEWAPCPASLTFANLPGSHTLAVRDTRLTRLAASPALSWTAALPSPRLIAAQFPALLSLGSGRRQQQRTKASRLPRLLFQSNAPGTAEIRLVRRSRTVERWSAAVALGPNALVMPRPAWLKLAAGRYTLVVTVRNAAGASRALKIRFDAVRRSRG
jgi:hypothetical protein